MRFGVTAVLACAAGLAVVPAALPAPGPPRTCAPGDLHLSLETLGDHMGTLVFLAMINRSTTSCRVVEPVVFEITQAGSRARIRNNPLRALAATTLAPHLREDYDEPHFWWGNWCGSRRDLAVVARLGGMTVRSTLRAPVCVQPGRPSVLVPPQ